jgi:hypothetical protein
MSFLSVGLALLLWVFGVGSGCPSRWADVMITPEGHLKVFAVSDNSVPTHALNDNGKQVRFRPCPKEWGSCVVARYTDLLPGSKISLFLKGQWIDFGGVGVEGRKDRVCESRQD